MGASGLTRDLYPLAVPRDYRKKASEVFAETKFVFGKKGSFADVFPEIASLRVHAVQRGDGVEKWNAEQVLTEANAGEYLDCSNPVCFNGGVAIGQPIRYMVAKRETHLEELKTCQGNEASAKGRKVYRKCLNHFNLTIDLTYRPTDESSS